MTKLAGVFSATKKDGTIYYRSSITYKNKHISLGSFTCDSDAHKAYEDARFLLETSSLKVEDFVSSQTALSFTKWVVLCNFRDNNMYCKTPIYLRPKFFYYYFDSNSFLIFSMEDLFFYASHTIMRRGGHYFVADYGMQLNIMNRYGIKNYAVCNKDYRFINGNPYDFRYENIEILNTFHGVSYIPTHSKHKYVAKIHLNGYWVIGYYPTAIEAAIAYNKAADTLTKNGITKKYPLNYIEEISPKVYADLYHKIKINHSITELHSPQD